MDGWMSDCMQLMVLAKLKLAVPKPRLPFGDGSNYDFDVAYLYSAFLRK